MGTDFVDDDLLQPDSRHKPAETQRDPATRSLPDAASERLARQKEELTGHVSSAVKEIERLRMKQEELEREKSRLKELTRKQDEYEREKRDLIEKLDRGMITIEKEESEAARMVELLAETRSRFRNTLEELRSISEENWTDENFQLELNRAATVVENARMDYKKGLARIEASSWHKGAAHSQSDALEKLGGDAGDGPGFRYFLRFGIAVTLPLIITLILFFLIHLALTAKGII